MAVPGGPNIITDGLVTYFDAANVDSFRGEPTTNLALNPEFTSTSNWSVATNGGGSLSVSGGFGKIVMGTPGSFNYLNQSRTISIPPNTVCTWSAYFKNNRVGNFAIRLILFDGASVPAQPQTTVVLDGSGGLKRYSVSASYSGTTTSVRLDILSGSFYSGLSNSDVEFTKCQFELKPYVTEFVNGTRGTTVATGGGVADISNNNNHATINGTTFNTTNLGNIVFDGTDDYLIISENQNLNLSTTNFTFSFWIKCANVAQNGPLIYKRNPNSPFDQYGIVIGDTGTDSGFSITPSKKIITILRGGNSDQARIVSEEDLINTSNGNWFQFVVIRNNNNLKIYYNGVEKNTINRRIDGLGILSDISVPNQELRTGSSNTNTYLNGQLSNVQIYNRSLSADEILQNYNSTKSRFGIT